MNFPPEQPIQHPGEFFGHARLTRRVLSFLKRSQNVSLVGPRKIGKTSLLNYVSHPAVIEENNLSSDEYLFIYVDCGQLTDSSKSESYHHIGELIREKASNRTDLSLRPIERFDDLSRISRQIKRRRLKIVVALDHFDLLTKNDALDIVFFDSLRSLAYNLTYLVASRRSLYELQEKAPRISGSPFFNIFQTFDIPPLDSQARIALLSYWYQRAKVSLPEEVLEFIAELSGGHPHDLWQLGRYATELFRSEQYGSINQWVRECRRLLEEKTGFLRAGRENEPP